MNKLKVLHIITRLDPGGSAYNTMETVARLNKDRYETDLISGFTRDPHGDIAKFIKIKNIEVNYVNDLIRALNPLKDLKCFFRLLKLIKKGKYDIVHTHSSKAGIIGRWAAWFAGTKYIVHTPHGHVFYGYFNWFVNKVFLYAEILTALITHKIITLTKKGKEEHIQFKVGKTGKFVPIYSGIDLEKYNVQNLNILQKKKELGIPEEAFVFGAVARLDPIKGNKYLIEAMPEVLKKHINALLLLVGDGELMEELKARVDELGISKNIVFAGFRQDVAEIFHMIDVFVLGSLNEGMGRVILEAMACEKPVVATKTGGIPELVVSGETGILVPVKDVKGFSDAFTYLIDNPSKIKEFGAKGKKRVSDIFSVEKMVQDIEKLYDELSYHGI